MSNAGWRTCDICKSYEDCIAIELLLGRFPEAKEHRQTYSVCHGCVSKGVSTELAMDIVNYGRKDRKRTNKVAKKSEEKTAKETGGQCTGYFPSAGDSRNRQFFFEDKTRIGGDKKSYRLTEDVILKGRDQARRAGLTPVFRIHLKNVSIGVMLWDDMVDTVTEPSDET